MVGLSKIGIIFVILVLLIGGAFAANTVFVSYDQTAGNGTLRVLGSLDSASITDLNIRVIDKPSNDLFLQYTLPGTEASDVFNTTTLRYRHDFNNVNDWDANVYEIRVIFSSGPNSFTTFDIPYILNLQNQINELDQNILDLEAAVALLDSNSATFATDINNINNQLLIVDANLIDLQNQITDLNNDMNVELVNLQSQIDALDSRLTSVESTLTLMTHGTIWLAYDFNGNTLRVKGEFPIGTASITLKVRDINLDATAIADVTIISTDSEFNATTNEYNYIYSGVNSWNPEVYDISAQFYDGASIKLGITINTTFDLLKLIDMQNQITQLEQDINDDITLINAHLAVLDQNVIDLDQRITDLNAQLTQRIDDINAYFLAEVARLDIRIDDVNADLQLLRAQVNRMNHGTVWLAFDRNKENGWLNVKGEAPEGATKAIISILDLDGAKQFDDVWDNVNASNNNYAYDYNNVNDWNPEVYQIKVQFVDDTNAQIAAVVNTQFYALYTIQDFQGFSFQGNELVNSCFRLDNTMQVSFEFGALERARYDFNLIITENSTEHNFSLVSNELIEKYNTTSYNGFVDLTGVPTGNWTAKLIAYKRNDGSTIESNDFNVNIIDACANITSGIMVTSPTTNSLMTMPYPYGSYKAGVYWIQTGPFTLSAQMSTDTQIKGLNCTYKYIDSANGLVGLAYEADINKNADQNAGTCSRTINPLWWNNINQINNSTTLEIYSSFSIDQDEMDSIEIGLDDESPTIASIIPSTNAYDNNMLIDVTATDNLSGIASVEIRMIHTDTSTVYPNYWADFNADTNTFQATIDTLILPNGKYDINGIVIDVAGNQSNLVVDPIIDHNVPTITSMIVTGNPMLRNETITVDVNANDVFDSNNVAGVDTITLNVIEKATATIMLSKDMNLVSGNEATGSYRTTFDTNTDWNLGEYTLSFDIWDKTVNVLHLNTDSIDVNLLQNYYFNIANQSKTIDAGTTTTFTLDGNFRDDLGSAGPFIDGNTILITSSIVSNVSVIFDGNGFYRLITNAIGAGTYYIDLNYNTSDYNYIHRVTVSVGNPSLTTGGGGGGGGGAPLASADTNEPAEEIIIEETEEDTGTGDEGTGDTETDDTGTGDTGTGEIGTGDTGSPTTGFFGLGEAEPTILAGVGALAILGLAGGIFYFKKFK